MALRSLRFAAQINESVTMPNYSAKSCETVPAQPVDATPSDINLFSKGGVYDI
jgi:hypothetical protein